MDSLSVRPSAQGNHLLEIRNGFKARSVLQTRQSGIGRTDFVLLSTLAGNHPRKGLVSPLF